MNLSMPDFALENLASRSLRQLGSNMIKATGTEASSLLCLIAVVVGPVVNHNGIGYPVMQRLLSLVEHNPQESCAAHREAQQVAECAQAGLSH